MMRHHFGGIRRLLDLGRGRRAADRAVDDEVRFHLDMRVDALMRAGLSREAAIQQSRAEFGDVADATRELRSMSRRRRTRVTLADWWRDAIVDTRIAIRSYRRSPRFTVVVLLTLAVGVSATTAMFSVVNTVLLRPLPYTRPDRLVLVRGTNPSDVGARTEVSYPDLQEWRAKRDLFNAVEAFEGTNVTFTDGNRSEMLHAARASSGFLTMLGVSPTVGGQFTAEDDVPNGTRSVLLSHQFWVRRLGGDPGVVGRTIRIEAVPHVIRGVLPARFRFTPAGDAEVWLPLGRSDEIRRQRFNRWLSVIARLNDGVTVEVTRRRMSDFMRIVALEHPETNRGHGVTVMPLRDDVFADVGQPLGVMFGAVAILLLIACANVASLIVARSVERGREIAIRAAIGASRARLVRQLLTEHVVLAVGGAAVGAWIASVLLRVTVTRLPDSIFDRVPLIRDVRLDSVALVFTGAVAVVTAIAFGLAPAFLASRGSASDVLRSGNRAGNSRTHVRLRDAIVTAEVAMTFVLLVAAVLVGRSLVELLRVDPGFVADNVGTVRVALSSPEYRNSGRRQQAFFEEALVRARALPGVAVVGAISTPPLQGGDANGFRVDGAPEPDRGVRPEAKLRAVAGDYFKALRIPVLAGRALGARDDTVAAYAIVINQSLARRTFGSRPAVGQRLRIYGWQDSAWTIVGVVGDVKTGRLDESAPPTIYYPHLQGPANRMTILARGASATPSIATLLRTVNAIDPTVAVYSSGTMTELVARSPAVYSRRSLLVLFGAFAVVALGLALVGLYGVLAFAVTQRTREIAIRSALGASTRDVLALVVRDALRVGVAGVVVGAGAALLVSRSLSAFLFGVSSADLPTYAVVSVVLVLVAAAASWAPARRACRFDPVIALRSD